MKERRKIESAAAVSDALEDPGPSNLHCDIFQISVKHSYY